MSGTLYGQRSNVALRGYQVTLPSSVSTRGVLGVLDTWGLALLGSFLFFSLFLKNAVRFANCLLKKFAHLGKIWMEAVSQNA